MKPLFPITRARVRNHWEYGWWKYALLLVVAALFWYFLSTATRYQVPRERRLEVFADSGYVTPETSAALGEALSQIREKWLPGIEEVVYIPLSQEAAYGDMQLQVWVTAGQGDVLLLKQERFQALAGSGMLLDLQPYLDSGALPFEGLGLAEGSCLAAGQARAAEQGPLRQYGLPLDSVTGLLAYGIAPEGLVLCLRKGGQEQHQAAVTLVREWLGQLEREGPQALPGQSNGPLHIP